MSGAWVPPITLSRRRALGLLAAGAGLPATAARALGPGRFTGPPVLEDAVQIGQMPPVEGRLPRVPRVVDLSGEGLAPGRHGGTIRMLIGGQRDVRYMAMNGYARLVGYDRDLRLVADILERYEVQEGRIFTFRLRPGHRWSDGEPFTSEDFRYCWQDVIEHPELGGLPRDLLADGAPPWFEQLDEHTVRYSWDAHMPDLLPGLAAPVPVRLFLPAHYMKQFHADYQTPERLAELVQAQRVDDWSALHTKMSRYSRPENPDLPTLEPWRPRTAPPAQQFVFERNPYFHRVDTEGRQLPYVDRVLLNVSSYEIIPAKVATGESDLQPMGLDFADYTLLKEAESRYPVKVSLWTRAQGSRVALLPNLTCGDAVWRPFLRDVRVRRAMSLAIDRTEINKVLFFGLARESANTVLPQSPLYREEYRTAWTEHDPEQANALLDAAGMGKARLDGYRRLPDGRVAGIMVETAGESTVETDVLELVADHFREIGLALWTRVSQRDLFRSRIMAGQVTMSVWYGLDNALPTAAMPPYQLAPTADDQYQWPVWGVHYLSQGAQGQPPELPEVQQLLRLVHDWRATDDDDRRAEIWHRMLAIHADQVFTIGTVNSAPQPLLHRADLRNIPEKGLMGYLPTSLLGVYMPDTFWFDAES
ncbi:ABC transporter substrate-binding protein [Frigidibacter sp. MR17.24]|uniref:ABC transporter substrate-binding protein n=1 Tax=Frigidibacter sp. MR17.24 TaxID=3127345 RepID=UPI003012AB32